MAGQVRDVVRDRDALFISGAIGLGQAEIENLRLSRSVTKRFAGLMSR